MQALANIRTKILVFTEGAALMVILGTFRITDAAVGCSTQSSVGLQDPLQFCNIYDFVQGVLFAFVQISMPILSFFIVYAGFKFVMAQGKPGELTKARDNFKWLILGAILILGAWALAELIRNTVGQIAG